MTFVKNFSEKYKTYYEDKTKTNKDFPGLLARLSRLEEPTYTESYFFKFVKAALPENTNTTGFNKVYADEVKSVFKMKAFTTSEIKSNMFMGLPVFFYALADHIGFGITPESKLLPEKWVLANEISATSPLIKLNMNNINTIGRFIIPSLYAEGIGAPITSADNVYYFVTKDGLQTGYNQANSVSAFSSNYLSSLSTINAALNHPTDYLNDAALGNNYTPNTPKEKKARGGGFGRWLSSDATSKLGILALSYYMQSQQAKLDSARLKAQLELQEITARANQCSSMDCNYQKDLCLMQQVPCRTNREIIFGWTWGKKDDLCYLRDIDISSLDTSSEQYKTYQKCITCDPIYTNTQAYTNPYSGQSEQMTLYQICLMNVTSSLLNRNKCFDLINVNAQSPGLVSNSDIRNCFTGLTPTRNNSSINYIPPTITPTTPAATTPETKKKDAAGTGTPAGGGSPSAPGSGVENKAAPKPDDSVYGKYKNTNTDAPRFNQGSGYYGGSGGSSGTGSDVKSSGLTAPVPSSTPAELTIKAMMEEQIRDMRSKLGATE
ncbi:MAG: hypothetical protein NTY22_09845 [Proteobacteria bacterium]|nr:hypothetical protein [Pseudomonadota bacterium]